MTHKHQALPMAEQVIWLIGASSGIGAALVGELQKNCKALIISARNEDKLQEVATGFDNVSIIPVDITQPSTLAQAAQQLTDRFGHIDTLVANAGTAEYVDVNHFDAALIRRVHETNFMGLVNCVEAALPLLRKSQSGYIVGVSSSVAYLPMPRAQAYGSSKAAVSHFLEAMRADLVHLGMDVSIVCPGFVKTPLTDKNDFPMPMRISAEDAARYMVKGMQKRQFEIHFPKRFSYLLKLIGNLPDFLRLRITASMSRAGTPDNKDSHS
ncbi:SDR family NAD(P)-dependent oxidoreductase [Thalassolituus oleivorans]|jgi:short-subunit dehydrogenase|uniref:Short-chain dehydrogenase/reductase SDR n=1 Tax=Thalassolituus oleivorans MIL-1 TaxID=1298593 RepID=M5DVB6_9GAMM|nr:SDR family NAD(P)-dependent oxidoreductase [Thalassolituus oleivorans]MCA6128284.1 hypothetical protein [Thalassolituus oleivorans 4BN06-13]CCU73208.1 short-chain dehydrogenase/reductase SDR [Thalassolituus oleivorans MIL-1]